MDDSVQDMTSSYGVPQVLQEKQQKLEAFAAQAAKELREADCPRSTTVLINTGQRKGLTGKIVHQMDIGWRLQFYCIRKPHLRYPYLLANGSFAIDAVGKSRKYCGEFSADVKIEKYEYPDLIPLRVDELLHITDCQDVALSIKTVLVTTGIVTERHMSPEIRQFWHI